MPIYADFNAAADGLEAAIYEPDFLTDRPLEVVTATGREKVLISPKRRRELSAHLEAKRKEVTEVLGTQDIEATEKDLEEHSAYRAARFTEGTELLEAKRADLARGASLEELDEALATVGRYQGNLRRSADSHLARIGNWEESAPAREDPEAYAVRQLHDMYARYPAFKGRISPLYFPW